MGTLRFARMTMIALAMCAAGAISSSAQAFNVLDNFNGTDGSSAGFTLVEGSDGNFYGTTAAGGANGYGGTVFKVTPDGALTTLYNFCSQTNCTDGATPQAGLLEGKDGNFYGTTYYGGTNCVFNSQQSGCGTIFKITPEGALTTLYSFCNKTSCTDGIAPASGLILGKNGNFYGTTFEGGGSAYDINCFCNGGGTVFEFSTTAGLTTLYNFCSATNSGGYCLDGAAPVGIVQTKNGALFGMTYDGGVGTDNSGGTIFTIGANGRFFTLYSFCSVTVHCMDGAYPRSSVTVGKDGNLYGVTPLGATNGHGVIFKMTPTGKMTTLYRFGSGTHGAGPYSALVQLSDGNFYGTTTGGGQTNTGVTAGTVFRMTPGGKLTTLYNFCSEANCTDGSLPNAGVVQGSNGNLYGVTVYGGSAGDGVVYSLSLK